MNESTVDRRDSMILRVQLFSVLKEKIGQDALEVSLPVAARGADLLDELSATYRDIEPYRPVIRLAVNESYTREDVVLHEGDEVALITPVSGG